MACSNCDLFPLTSPEQVNAPEHLEYVSQKINPVNISNLQGLLEKSMKENDEQTYWRAYIILSKFLLSVIDSTAIVGAKKWHPDCKTVAGIR